MDSLSVGVGAGLVVLACFLILACFAATEGIAFISSARSRAVDARQTEIERLRKVVATLAEDRVALAMFVAETGGFVYDPEVRYIVKSVIDPIVRAVIADVEALGR